MPSLNILVLTDRDWSHPQGGGTGTNLRYQIEWWLAAGHRVTVVASGFPGGEALEEDGELTIHRLGGRSTVFPRTILSRETDRLVKEADVVLEVINGLTFLTPLWVRRPRVALIHHIHREHYIEEMGSKGRVAAWALETTPLRALYRSTSFMTVSHASAQEIAALGVPAEQIVVNYNGVDIASLGPGLRREKPTILYLGRLKRYKRVEWLLDSLYALPEATLHIAGDGDARPAIEAEIARRGLQDRVVLHGFVDEDHKRELLRSAWVNVTASSVEGWCLTVLEAAACGTPSVAMAVGGLPEAIVDRCTGLLARSRPELTAQVVRIMRDPLLREELGSAAVLRARTLQWSETAQRTLDVLHAQIEGRSSIVAPRRLRFVPAQGRRVTRIDDRLVPGDGTGSLPADARLPEDAVLLGRAIAPERA